MTTTDAEREQKLALIDDCIGVIELDEGEKEICDCIKSGCLEALRFQRESLLADRATRARPVVTEAMELLREQCAAKATSFLVGDPSAGVPLRKPMAHEIADAIRSIRIPATAQDASAEVGVGQAVGWICFGPAGGVVATRFEAGPHFSLPEDPLPKGYRAFALVPIDPPAEGGEG